MAGRYLAAAERYGSLRDVASALLLLARARAALGELAQAAEIVQASDEVVARIPEPGDLAVDRLLAALTLAHYTDGDWPELIDRIVGVTGAGPSPVGLELAGELAVANARAGRGTEARAAIPSLLDAASRIPPLTFSRDAALFLALTAIWEVGAAEHAHAARQLEKSVAAGAGGGHTATPRLALARLNALAGDLSEARDEFSRERARLDGAGIRPLRAIVDYDEAVAIGASGRGSTDAETLLDQAFRQFQGLGMPGWARRAETLQASGFEAAAQPGGRLFFSYPAGLSRPELDVVRLMAAGQSAEAAARELDLEKAVVEGHAAAALEKFGAANLDELPRIARRYGLGGT
jgi:DNA-binding CsgD family transcriptional regulator